ncbi:transposase insH for insertion sequence element IS5R [Klebsiella pneumoniae MGH 45]|nr:transposase insH for insertion sequence element IS5R [Klebsiella pneumoniae MGH 45]
MSHQLTFADSEFSTKRRQTRKEIFLSRMEQILPWQNMVEVIEPFYPKAGNGRRPYPLETMLRIHCMQHWYNLSDGAMEDALYEIASMRLFARLSLDSALPDRTTIMNFRHLLEQHQLARQLFKTINRWLAEAGVMMTQGTLVDATIIEAPSSTKNKEQQRDPEMHQTKKGNQWHFGMKAHIIFIRSASQRDIMSHQLTFADSEFSTKRRQTRKEIFLSRMEQILPWQNMVEVIEPFYPKAGNGRRPYPLETMLRIHCMQHWYNLSDGAMEDALYEIASMRLFARLSLDSALPDRTTIMNFRHLLEQHQLARQLFKTINRWLAEAGVMMTQGTLVDATIIEAPSSTKNKEQQRDPEMHQTKKGNQWHFGMKAHIGVDAKSGLTHSLVTTAANEHDLNQLGNLLHGEEQFVSADAGYQGAPQREELAEVDVDWLIAERPGKVKTLKQHPRKNKTAINIEYMKASIRARVEHPFRIIKRQFGFVKARYKGLLKNDNQLAMLFTLANLFRVDQMIRQWERSQ